MTSAPLTSGRIRVTLSDDALLVALLGPDGTPVEHRLDIGMQHLGEILGDSDPPAPDRLTNAIGAVADHLDDLVRIHDHLLGLEVDLVGPDLAVVAAVEVGHRPPWPYVLDRPGAEEVFRAIATEPRADRLHNPGLPAAAVDRVVAAGCATVAVMRRLHCSSVTVHPGTSDPGDEPPT